MLCLFTIKLNEFMETKTRNYYEVYCTAGFYPHEYIFAKQEDAIKKANHESAIATKTEWAEFIVTQVVETRIVIYNTRENYLPTE